MKIAALILHFELDHLTNALVEDLRRFGGSEIIVVDNGSSHAYPGDCDSYICLDRNYYVTGGFNRGVAMHDQLDQPDAYWMLNNDISFDMDVLSPLVAVLEAHPDAAVVSPAVANTVHGHMHPRKDKALCEVAWVDWVAPLVRAEAWRDIGEFDERTRGNGLDLDWCYRARQKGWRCYVEHKAIIEHEQGATRRATGGHGIAHHATMEAVLTEKWGEEWREKLRFTDAMICRL